MPSLSLITFLSLMSSLSEINITTSTFFSLELAWYIILHPITFYLYMSWYSKWFTCKQHIVGSYFCLNPCNFCLWIVILRSLMFKWLLIQLTYCLSHVIIFCLFSLFLLFLSAIRFLPLVVLIDCFIWFIFFVSLSRSVRLLYLPFLVAALEFPIYIRSQLKSAFK